jgi:hypothetical protein
MSQIDFNPAPGSTHVGLELTFGTTNAVTRAFPISPVDMSGLTQENVVPQDEKTRLFGACVPVQGLKGGTLSLGYYLRPDGTQLTSANAAATHPLGLILKGLMGGEAANNGSTVAAAGSSTSSVVVAAGHGSRFKIGQWVAAESAGSVLTARRITNISTDTLTVRPNWTTPTASTGIVVNSYTYYLTQQNSQTLVVQHAKADSQASAYQWTLNGCNGALDVSLERGQLARVTANLQVATWTGPSAQGISVAAATDSMAAPVLVRGATTLLQAHSATTSTHYAMKSVAVRIAAPTTHTTELGGVEGKTSSQRTGGRPAVEVTLRMRSDLDLDNASSAYYTGQTKLSVVVIVPVGTGLTQRFLVLDIPTAIINAKPRQVDDGGLMATELTLMCLEDETTTTSGLSGTNLDLAVSPIRIALI